MRLDEVTPLLTAVTTERLAATLSAWRVGQILDAVVTRITNVGSATLNVNNLSIEVHSELPLIVGSRLRLEVAQSGPQIALRVLTPPAPEDTLAAALRRLAPQQSDLAPVLTELTRIAQSPAAPPPLPYIAPAHTAAPTQNINTATAAAHAAALAAAPPELRELAKNLIERIRTPAQTATADGLKQAVKNAGPFFEHQLATASGVDDLTKVLNHDLKAGLLKLSGYLTTLLPPGDTPPAPLAPATAVAVRTSASSHPAQPATPLAVNMVPLEILAKEVDAALARITTQQLLSIPEHRSDAPQWIFDLPVRSGDRVDIFHLHVFREKHPRDPKQAPAWCVRLSFDLVTLGKVGALVTLFAGTVSVAIWAQQDVTARLFTHHLAALRSELQTAGIAISHLHCECGDAPFTPDAPLKQKRSGLIDERA